MAYLAVYAFVNLAAFSVAALVGSRYPAQRLTDYRGLVRDEPGAGWSLAFALVALAGLPPASSACSPRSWCSTRRPARRPGWPW